MGMLDQAVAELGTEIEVRNLRANDIVPDGLRLGFKQFDREWTWIAISHGAVVSALLAAPCHGMVFIVRLGTLPDFGWTLPRLFRCFVRDANERGFQGYFTFLDASRKEEAKLLRILERAECMVTSNHQTCAGGKLSDLEKW